MCSPGQSHPARNGQIPAAVGSPSVSLNLSQNQLAGTFCPNYTAQGNDYYVRQFRDQKIIADGEMVAPRLLEFATACGAVLARSHARTGDPVAIDAYIGNGRQFDRALVEFAFGYADQTERDHQQLAGAARSGVIASATGW